jgi:predicted GH43/DUF377 family glycosyl hydrolase
VIVALRTLNASAHEDLRDVFGEFQDVLLDLEDPSKIIAAPRDMILAAETPYECVGQVPNVVFTGGAVEMPDGRLLVYYGGADTRMCVAETTVERMLDFCLAAR